jgi:asparagine synthase (glutamine-hydrolysing)
VANFVLALDGDAVRCAAFLEAARRIIAPLDGLTIREHQLGDLAMVWALGKHAPWSEQLAPDSVSVLAGHAIDELGNRLDASHLHRRWSAEQSDAPSAALDGYHLAIVYEPARQLTLEADLLGFFPVYYWNQDGVLIVASSCELFGAHPTFSFQPDQQGIAGMLMTNGLVANRTLVTGVRRLMPGHRLIGKRTAATSGYKAQEQFQYRVTGSNRYAGASFSELVEVADAAMRRTIKRQTPPGVQTTQLLSGGLDSRLVTGYLKESNINCKGVCLGQPYDFEATAARSVAETLDFPFHLIRQETCCDGFVERTRHRAHWLHLSAGIGCGGLSDATAVLQEQSPCFWSGMSLDDLLGGGALGYGYDPATATWSFNQFAKDTSKWGLKSADLARLLKPSGGAELVEAVRQSFDRDFHRHDDAPHRLVYHARLQGRHRYHLGNVVWELSFASWPLLFVADRAWLETFIDIPPVMAMGKRLEMELLRKKFPQLLSAPIDVNSWHHGWINPSWLHRCRQRLNKIVPIERAWHNWYWRRWRGTDRRRYWRFYDFDLPNWRAVRHYAEPLRERLYTWLDRHEVDRLLPPPHIRLPKNNSFSDPAIKRNLLGLAIWSDRS